MIRKTVSDTVMVRLFIIGAAFLTVTLALILLQPGSTHLDEVAADTPASQPQPLISDASAAEEDTVTRTSTDLTDLALAATAQPSPSQDAAAEVSALVLAALQETEPSVELASAASAGQDDALRALTSSIVADLTGSSKKQAAKPQAIEDIIVQAMKKGQSDSYIDALLNEAHERGEIAVPDALQTNEGRVDTSTLLTALVAKSTPKAAAPRIPLEEMDGVEVRVVQRAGETKQYNFYTVQKGDSLGAIAQRFYGDANLYTAIFDANRTFLSSPNRIRVGQRLSIPSATTSG